MVACWFWDVFFLQRQLRCNAKPSFLHADGRHLSGATVTIDMHVHVVEAFVAKVLSGCLAWATAFVKTVWDAFVQDCQQTHVKKSAQQQTSVCHQSNPYQLSVFPSESVTISTTLPGISKTYAGISMVRRCASAVFSPLAGEKMAEHLQIWRVPDLAEVWSILGLSFLVPFSSLVIQVGRRDTKEWCLNTIGIWTGKEQ